MAAKPKDATPTENLVFGPDDTLEQLQAKALVRQTVAAEKLVAELKTVSSLLRSIDREANRRAPAAPPPAATGE